MRRKKENKDKRGGGLSGFLIVATLALVIGVGTAAMQLARRPVPDRPTTGDSAKGEVICIRGQTAAQPGWDERAKEVWHAKPGHYVFSEGDINSLIEKHLSPVIAIEGIENVHVEELPNVRFLDDGLVQVSTVVTIPGLAGSQQFVYQVRGRVVPGGFHPEMGWFGQCPVPLFNMAILQAVRRQMLVDKDVTGLPGLRKKVRFSRAGDSIVVDVLP